MRSRGCSESPDDSFKAEQKRPDGRSTTVPSSVYRYPMVWFAVAWAVGIFLAGLPTVQAISSTLPLFMGSGAAIMAGLALRSIAWLSSTAVLTGVLLGAIGYALSLAPSDGDSLSAIATRKAQPVALRGVISSAATWSPSQFPQAGTPDDEQPWVTIWSVRWSALRSGSEWKSIDSSSKLMVPGRLYGFLPGDEIEVFGSLRSIESATNPGMRDFAKYSRRQGVFVSVKANDDSQIRIRGVSWRYLPSRIRGLAVEWVDAAFQKHISHGQAPLAAALVFGQREQVDWELRQQLMASGTIHMLAISGMHVEMIAGTLFLICLVLSVRPRTMFVVIVGICLLYAGLAGGRPPVLRAVVLVAGFSAARYWGLQPRIFNLLGLAAVLLLVLDPNNIFSPGVHLSFLAVSTISIFHQSSLTSQFRRNAVLAVLEENLSRGRRWLRSINRRLWDAGRISFWVWLMASPLIWSHFNLVSPIAVPLNVILAFPLVIGLLACLLTAIFGWIPPFGWLLGGVSGSSLGLINWMVDQAYRISGGHWWLPSPPVWWMVLFYLTVVVWLVVWRDRYRRLLAGTLIVWVVVGVLLFVPGPRGLAGWPVPQDLSQEASLRCTFLDVGHGTSVLIELPDGRLWIYDAGRLGDNQRSFQYIAPSVWDLQAARIDTLIISHADSDHYNAAIALLDRFSIGQVASTERFWSSQAKGAMALREALHRKKIPRLCWSTETVFAHNDMPKMEILHPASDFRGESDNADSLCLQIEFAGIRLLLCGDIEGSGLYALCESAPRNCHILMAPHHGSLSHDSSGLLQWCRPEVIVISGGERTTRPAVIEKFSVSAVLGITFRDGAIQVTIHPDGTYETRSWSGGGWQPL